MREKALNQRGFSAAQRARHQRDRNLPGEGVALGKDVQIVISST
jgi:hypothetical protein